MPAKFKAKPLSSADIQFLKKMVSCAAIPSDPDLLTTIVELLIERINRHSPSREAKYLNILVRNLALLESGFSERSLTSNRQQLSPKVHAALYAMLKDLVTVRVRRERHLPLTVVAQRDLMATYLKAFKYPRRNTAARRLWFDDHALKLVLVLSAWHCLCGPLDWKPSNNPNAAALGSVADRIKKTCREWPKMTEAPVTYETLAVLHNTTPENILKLLQHFHS